LKRHKPNEFKLEFEFKQPKIMHKHECNNKFLWFIYFIIEKLKFIKEIKYHLIILRDSNKGF
jgi:hypothetical protein